MICIKKKNFQRYNYNRKIKIKTTKSHNVDTDRYKIWKTNVKGKEPNIYKIWSICKDDPGK